MTNQTTTVEGAARRKPHALQHDHGFYHSCSIALPVEEVYAFCRDKQKMELLLKNLPEEYQKFLHLGLKKDEEKKGSHHLTWESAHEAKVHFTGTLILSEAPAGRGTYLTAEAFFETPGSALLTRLLNMDDPEPSMLVGMFLKRLKAQIETGEIPTTKGQPSGREELKKLN